MSLTRKIHKGHKGYNSLQFINFNIKTYTYVFILYVLYGIHTYLYIYTHTHTDIPSVNPNELILKFIYFFKKWEKLRKL